MKRAIVYASMSALSLAATTDPATAQMRTGWSSQVDGLATFQGSADLSGGGDFSASRSFLRAQSLYTSPDGYSVGFSASIGQFDYDFSETSEQPWTDIRDIRLSVPVRLPVGETTSVFLSPQVRWDYQSGASASDGLTYGVFAGVAWKFSETLTIGPAFGAYSRIEDSGADVFPAVLVNWDITERWNLTTGSGIGATSGPGLRLGYAVTDTMKVSLSARSESVRFRLDDQGTAPGGVGEDESVPVVVSLDYSPNPGMSFSAFVGAEFDGGLTLDDASGRQVRSQSYDTAPLAGVAFRLRF